MTGRDEVMRGRALLGMLGFVTHTGGSPMPASRSRIAVAEGIGTFVLVLGGAGTAVLATGGFFGEGSVGVLGVALAFGLALLVMAYAIGNISGCHINPAVSVGLVLARKLSVRELPTYLLGQVVGGVLAGLAIWAIAAGAAGGFTPDASNFAVNGWGELSPGGFGLASVALTEIVLTALLVFVVLSTTHRRFVPVAGGLAVGLTLALIHLISIPISNTSVNPARSLGVAVFAGGDAVVQLWAFVVFPLLGAGLGALAWVFLDEPEREPEVRVIDIDLPAEGAPTSAEAQPGAGVADAREQEPPTLRN
jgi:aquaporin Z